MSTDKNIEATDDPLLRVRERLRTALVEKRMSARELSRRSGFNLGYVGDVLEGRSKAPDFERIMRLADTLDIPVDELTGGASAESSPRADSPLHKVATEREAPQGDAGMIPLYAARIAINEPWVPIRFIPIDHVPALPALRMVDGAYAVTVFNDLSAPRYFVGETIYISPIAPIKVGDFTFGRHVDGRCGVGRLAKVEGGIATWESIATGDTVSASLIEMESFHRIIGSVS